MEPDSKVTLGSASQSGPTSPASGTNDPLPADDRSAEQHARGRTGGVILGGGLVAVLALGALGYFYYDRDAGREAASVPTSEQAPSPASKDVAATTPRPAETVTAAAPRPAETVTPAAPRPAENAAAATPRPAENAAAATPRPVENVAAATPRPAENVVRPSPPPPTAAAPSAGPAAPSVAATPPASVTPVPPPGAQPPAVQAQPGANTTPIESAAPASPPTSMRDQVASLPKDELVFVQKPRVNIRSEPGKRGRVVGSASKGSQFKVVRRAGSWVQVEGDAGTGWIGGRLLGPQAP
jgi:hypothetical protein